MRNKHHLELFKVDADLTSLCRLAESEIKKSKIDREGTIFKMIGSVMKFCPMVRRDSKILMLVHNLWTIS